MDAYSGICETVCMAAQPHTVCACWCHGANHGVRFRAEWGGYFCEGCGMSFGTNSRKDLE